ncbi:MAG TPA: Crp/Fnr family transcriptional regulator [Pseudomonas sp.]|uniref:Crp/Fnr family transcriptional regulator n=1 Tax=Pseudomonas sp. TaxID=306 RepID=UPI002ED8381D
MTNGTQWRSWLINDQWFNELPAKLQDSLLVSMQQRRVTPGKLIFRKDYPVCGFYALLEGSLRMGRPCQQRQWLPPSHFKRPYWFGEVSLFEDKPRLQDIYAEDQVITLQMPQGSLRELLQGHPEYRRYFADLLGRKLGLRVPPAGQLTLLPTLERVAFRLLMLSEGYGEINCSVRIVSRNDLPSEQCLGLAAESIDRTLEELCERKVIRRDHDFISILDTDKLRHLARHRLTE